MKMNFKLKLLIGALIIILIALSGCDINETDLDDDLGDVSEIDDDSSPNIHELTNDNPEKIVIYYFWGEGCPACSTQTPYLVELSEAYDEVELKKFEIYRNRDNSQLFQEVAAVYGIRASGVPTTFISEKHWVGATQAMGSYIEELLQKGEWTNPGDKLN